MLPDCGEQMITVNGRKAAVYRECVICKNDPFDIGAQQPFQSDLISAELHPAVVVVGDLDMGYIDFPYKWWQLGPELLVIDDDDQLLGRRLLGHGRTRSHAALQIVPI